MARTILLPIDLNSPGTAERALAAALRLLDEGGTLHVASVLPSFGLPMVSGYFDRSHQQTARTEFGKALTAWVNKNVPKDVQARAHVLTGTVYDEIIRAADNVEADLIVIGAHRPELSDYLLGPNAARVVRHAKQSVYVVRSPNRRG